MGLVGCELRWSTFLPLGLTSNDNFQKIRCICRRCSDMDAAATSPAGSSTGSEEPIENGHMHTTSGVQSSSSTIRPSSAAEEPPPDVPVPLTYVHTYLGFMADIQRTITPRLQGPVYDLPVLPLEGIVMVPGATVPLSLNLHGAAHTRSYLDYTHTTNHRTRFASGARRPGRAPKPPHGRLCNTHSHAWRRPLCTVRRGACMLISLPLCT